MTPKVADALNKTGLELLEEVDESEYSDDESENGTAYRRKSTRRSRRSVRKSTSSRDSTDLAAMMSPNAKMANPLDNLPKLVEDPQGELEADEE